jgi:hypothetical protein
VPCSKRKVVDGISPRSCLVLFSYEYDGRTNRCMNPSRISLSLCFFHVSQNHITGSEKVGNFIITIWKDEEYVSCIL